MSIANEMSGMSRPVLNYSESQGQSEGLRRTISSSNAFGDAAT